MDGFLKFSQLFWKMPSRESEYDVITNCEHPCKLNCSPRDLPEITVSVLVLMHLQDLKDIAVLLVKYGWLTFSTRLVITHLSLFVFGSQVRCLLLKLDLLNEVVSD